MRWASTGTSSLHADRTLAQQGARRAGLAGRRRPPRRRAGRAAGAAARAQPVGRLGQRADGQRRAPAQHLHRAREAQLRRRGHRRQGRACARWPIASRRSPACPCGLKADVFVVGRIARPRPAPVAAAATGLPTLPAGCRRPGSAGASRCRCPRRARHSVQCRRDALVGLAAGLPRPGHRPAEPVLGVPRRRRRDRAPAHRVLRDRGARERDRLPPGPERRRPGQRHQLGQRRRRHEQHGQFQQRGQRARQVQRRRVDPRGHRPDHQGRAGLVGRALRRLGPHRGHHDQGDVVQGARLRARREREPAAPGPGAVRRLQRHAQRVRRARHRMERRAVARSAAPIPARFGVAHHAGQRHARPTSASPS